MEVLLFHVAMLRDPYVKKKGFVMYIAFLIYNNCIARGHKFLPMIPM